MLDGPIRMDDAFDGLVRDVGACRRCTRMAHSHALSEANGRLDADVVFVAEAPGRRGAAVTGVPLTRDESGRRFEEFLAVAGLGRGDAFVTNAVLCNPIDAAGRNRTPSAKEMASCGDHLERTVGLVGAPVVVALGRVALEALRAIAPHDGDLPCDAGHAVMWRGRWLVPMYHPGRRAILTRPHEAQVADWRGLGAIVREVAAGRDAQAAALE
jgi:uracil-DNA glycosylase family 4